MKTLEIPFPLSEVLFNSIEKELLLPTKFGQQSQKAGLYYVPKTGLFLILGKTRKPDLRFYALEQDHEYKKILETFLEEVSDGEED